MKRSEKELDPRVQRTRKLLQDAFIDLVAEKGYRNLTVKELTERATLNRVTFYLHYDHMEDLLVQTTYQLLQELAERKPSYQEECDSPDTILRSLAVNFEFFADYEGFMKSMLMKDIQWTFIRTIQDFHFQADLKHLRGVPNGLSKRNVDLELASRHMHSSFLGVIRWWFENDQPYTPKEMAEKVLRIYLDGVYQTLGYTISESSVLV